MEIKYVLLDDAYTTRGHDGSPEDPWSFEQLQDSISAGITQTYYLRGARTNIADSLKYGPGNYYITFDAWDLDLYGPWRMNFGSSWNYEIYKNGIARFTSGAFGAFLSADNMFMIYDDLSNSGTQATEGNAINSVILTPRAFGSNQHTAINCILQNRYGGSHSYVGNISGCLITTNESSAFYFNSSGTTYFPDCEFGYILPSNLPTIDSPLGAFDLDVSGIRGPSWSRDYETDSWGSSRYNVGDFYFPIGFSAIPLKGYPRLTVQFTSLIPDASVWYWDFGDGYISSARNPIHTYLAYPSSSGYSVSLSSDAGSFYKANYITLLPSSIYINLTNNKNVAFFGTTINISANASAQGYGPYRYIIYPEGISNQNVFILAASASEISSTVSAHQYNTVGTYYPHVYVSAAPYYRNEGYTYGNDIPGCECTNSGGPFFVSAYGDIRLKMSRINNNLYSYYYDTTSATWVSAFIAPYSATIGLDIQTEQPELIAFSYFRFQAQSGFPNISALGAPSWVYLPTYIEDTFENGNISPFWAGGIQANKVLKQIKGDWCLSVGNRYTTLQRRSTNPISGDFELEYGIKRSAEISKCFISIYGTSADDAASPMFNTAFYSEISDPETYIQILPQAIISGNSAFNPVYINPYPIPSHYGTSLVYKGIEAKFVDLAANSYQGSTISSVVWDYGDGVTSSTSNVSSIASHVYSATGPIILTVSAFDIAGNIGTGTLSFNVLEQPVSAEFSATPRTGRSPLSVQFTNLSTGATTYLWDFGDGSPISSDISPLHEYTSEGIFTVTLSAFNISLSDVKVKTNYIRVGLGHIGAFYFGPIDEVVSADVIEVSAVLLQPDVTVVDNISVTTIPFYIPVHVQLLQPTVYATQDIKVDFIGVPRAGVSPLTVDFIATVTFSPEMNNKYKVKEYNWCFDYDYTNQVCKIPWVTTKQNSITHVYTGYRGQKYSVKVCVTLELI